MHVSTKFGANPCTNKKVIVCNIRERVRKSESLPEDWGEKGSAAECWL